MNKPWFKAKKYGYGWGLPVSWQGWVVCFIYIVFIVWDFQRINSQAHSVSDTVRPFIIQMILATVLLLGIIYHTGEKLTGRRGKK